MRYNAYQENYEAKIVRNARRNKILAEFVREGYRRGYWVILLLQRLEHLKWVSKRLHDVPHRIVAGTDYKGTKWVEKVVHGKTKFMKVVVGDKIKVRERQKTTRKFEAGDIRVILANEVFKKGVSIKRLDVGIDGAAKKSKDDALQKFGRGLRLHPDKGGFIYFDLADEDPDNKKNWFAKAARTRKRAYKGAGITTRDFDWKEDLDIRENVKLMYELAEKTLRKETRQK